MVAIDSMRSKAVAKRAEPSFATTRFLMWLMLLPAVIDYKPKGIQNWATILYALIFLLSAFSSLVLIGQYSLRRNRGAFFAGVAAFIYAAVAYTSGALQGQEPIALLRAIPAILLFGFGMFSASALSNSPFPPNMILDEINKAAAVGLLVNLVIVAGVDGINFDTVRYQVLTGAAPLVCANLVALTLFGGWRPWSVASSALYAGLVLISITRTQVVIFAVVALFCVLFAGGKLLKAKSLPVQALIAISLIGLVIVGDALLPASPLERWTQRIFSAQEHHGYDITAVTRAGETGYQISKLKESVSGLMFGYGASAQNFYDGENARIIAMLLGRKAAYWTETGVGHNNYVGTIYVGGVLAGGLLLVVQFISLVKSSSILRRLDVKAGASVYSVPLAVAAYMTFGLLGGTMGSRSACLLFGLVVGFSFWRDLSPPPRGRH